jgi:hypothetical protein
MIDARETEILERPGANRVDDAVAGGIDVDLSASHSFEQIPELFV